MSDQAKDSAVFALALDATEGAGRVATGRLLERFGTNDALVATPREQVLARLPGVPGANGLVERLFGEAFRERIAEAEKELARLAEKQISVLTRHHPHWPLGVNDIERSRRPVVLYAFGDTSVLRRPLVGFLAQPPLEVDSFEKSQVLIRRLFAEGIVPVCGLQHGFDTVVTKLAVGVGRPAVAVASSGLARIPGPLRPAGAALTKVGGVLIAPFPLEHGPFPHDDVERARLVAAMSDATVVVGAPEESPEWRAAQWASENNRPLFSTLSTVPPGMQNAADAEGMQAVVDLAKSTL